MMRSVRGASMFPAAMVAAAVAIVVAAALTTWWVLLALIPLAMMACCMVMMAAGRAMFGAASAGRCGCMPAFAPPAGAPDREPAESNERPPTR